MHARTATFWWLGAALPTVWLMAGHELNRVASLGVRQGQALIVFGFALGVSISLTAVFRSRLSASNKALYAVASLAAPIIVLMLFGFVVALIFGVEAT